MKTRIFFIPFKSFSFTLKPSLNSLYKQIHPDLLGSVPDSFKTINEQAIVSINNYISAVDSEKGMSSQSIEFYVKLNDDSNKCEKFSVTLEKIAPSSSASYKNSLKEKLRDEIETKLVAIRQLKSPSMTYKKTYQTEPELKIDMTEKDWKKLAFQIERDAKIGNKLHNNAYDKVKKFLFKQQGNSLSRQTSLRELLQAETQ